MRNVILKGAVLLAALCLFAPAQGRAQTGGSAKGEAPQEEAAPPAPDYEADMLRLSEIMGALSYLRRLCDSADAAQWRERMEKLVGAEARDAGTRARLSGAFNQGYQGFALTYRTCTPSARVMVDRYLQEGERLSHAIASRFGG